MSRIGAPANAATTLPPARIVSYAQPCVIASLGKTTDVAAIGTVEIGLAITAGAQSGAEKFCGHTARDCKGADLFFALDTTGAALVPAPLLTNPRIQFIFAGHFPEAPLH